MADPVSENIAALRDEDWAVREEAAAALGAFRDPRAVGPLVGALRDSDRAVRDAAVKSLMEIGEPAVPALGLCLDDPNLTVQESAAAILARIADARVLAPLIKALRSQDWIVRMHAAKAIGRIRDGRAVPALVPLLHDTVKAVREEAALALVQIGEPAVPSLLEALKHEAWLVRLHAIEALGRMKAKMAVEPLLFVLFNDRDAAVRTDAARALGEIGDARAVEFLIRAMNDLDVRPAAVEALGKIGDAKALPALIDVVTGASKPAESRPLHGCGDRYDEEMFALEAAVKALGQIRDEAAMPVLIAALQNTFVREEAASALAKFGSAAVPALLEVLKRERDENILYYARQALEQAGWRPNRIS